MNKLFLLIIAATMLFSCSKDEDQPIERIYEMPSDTTSISLTLHAVVSDTIYINEETTISILPEKYHPDYNQYNRYIREVKYYLNELHISSSYMFPFSIKYKPDTVSYPTIELPFNAVITIKPRFSDERIIWKSNEAKVVIAERKKEETEEETEPQIIPVTNVSIILTERYPVTRKKILLGNPLIIEAYVLPGNATNKEVVFESSDKNVAEIENANDQYYIITNKIGFSEITAKSIDGNHKAMFELSVCDIDSFATVSIVVGTSGNSLTGFYSYAYARFDLSTTTTLPLKIKELKITDNTGEKSFVYNNINFRDGQKQHNTERIITAQGLQTYPAIGWKVEAVFLWNDKEYYISSINK
ncbi:hypothetical protein AwDysgo_20960 [Bacteroidales bacterium]|nr:hypothetical protein AwDysgo_20960 [Bacteroidales bacterium]